MKGAVKGQQSDHYLLKNSVAIISEDIAVIMFMVTIGPVEHYTHKESETLLTAKRFIVILFNILHELRIKNKGNVPNYKTKIFIKDNSYTPIYRSCIYEISIVYRL
jgi:hypothetical protein